MRRLATTLILAAVLGFAGSVLAEEAAEKKPLTIAEMNAAAQATAQRGSELSKTVDGLLRGAKEDGDMMRVTCLTDKLAQIDANMRTVQAHVKTLRAAQDRGVAEHEYTMIAVVGQKLDVLSQEAGQCVGADLFQTGSTTVQSTISKDLIDFEEDAAVPPTILPPSLPTLPPAVSGLR